MKIFNLSGKLEFIDLNAKCKMQNSEFRNRVAIVNKLFGKLEFVGIAQNAKCKAQNGGTALRKL